MDHLTYDGNDFPHHYGGKNSLTINYSTRNLPGNAKEHNIQTGVVYVSFANEIFPFKSSLQINPETLHLMMPDGQMKSIGCRLEFFQISLNVGANAGFLNPLLRV